MRNKIIMCILAAAFCANIFSGCGHAHTWSEATCAAPKTCADCGKTEGEALGHDFAEATCTAPSTCTRCGETEGEALGHDFAEATCAAPATCTKCGETEGEALAHTWLVATVDAPKTCEVCGETEGDKVAVDIKLLPVSSNVTCQVIDEERYLKAIYGDSDIDARIYDFDDNEISKIDVSWRNYSSFSTAGGYIFYFDGTARSFTLDAFDRDGEQQFFGVEFSKEDDVDIPDWKNDWPDAKLVNDFTIDICNSDSNSVHAEFYLDDQQMWFEDGSRTAYPEPKFDTSSYEYATYSPAIDGYYVKRVSDGVQGYVDINGKEICIEYLDATSFNRDGYALVSYDRKKYSIIDKDLNIIGKDVVSGASAACYEDGYFIVRDEDNNKMAVFVKEGSDDNSDSEDEDLSVEIESLKELIDSPEIKLKTEALNEELTEIGMSFDVNADDDTIIFTYTFVEQAECDDNVMEMLEMLAGAAKDQAADIAEIASKNGIEAKQFKMVVNNADGSEVYSNTSDF